MIVFTVTSLTLFLYVECDTSCIQECDVLVHIDSGPVCGKEEMAENSTRYYSFQGIPYGKAPVGDRRFAELQPVDPWFEPYYAYEEAPACPSRDLVYGSLTVKPKGMSEDCIYANVFVPATSNLGDDACDVLLPILVNIHGGGFQTGSGNRDMHGPEWFIMNDVIVVNFNYRLAVFGFLSLASDKIPGNNGLRDMLTLLRWVQRNARAFGGDPNQVTLLGHSVGATSVHLLTLSRSSIGLFDKVILMSGTAIPSFYSASPKHAKHLADMFLTELGVNASDPDEIHQILTELPLEDIMRANDVVQFKTGFITFAPVIEKQEHEYTRVVDDDPIKLIAQGRGKEIPMIIGLNQDEAETFRWYFMILNALNIFKENPTVILPPRLADDLSPEESLLKAKEVAKKYFNNKPNIDSFLKLITHEYFYYPSIKLAQWRPLLDSAPTYMYIFSYLSEFSIMKRANWFNYKSGAHGEDLTYVFRATTYLGDHVSIPPQTQDDHMRNWMSGFFNSFVKCSNPTCNLDDSQWPPLNIKELKYQAIAEPGVYNISSLTDELNDVVDFFDSIDEQIRTQTDTLRNYARVDEPVF